MYCPLFRSTEEILTWKLADSPYPSTPTSSAFHSDLSVVASGQSDADPFETLVGVGDVEKILADIVSSLQLRNESMGVDLQGSPSSLSGAEGMVRSGQVGTNGMGERWPVSNPENPFTNGASLSFHGTPRRYTPAQKMDTTKSNCGTTIAVFVLRTSPQIIEGDSSDQELDPEDRDDDDIAAYLFPYEGQTINELVSEVASLSLGTGLSTPHPTITPTRACVPAFPPASTPVSSPVAVIHPAILYPSTAEHTTSMEVHKDVLHPEVVNKGAPRPQGISDAVPMDGVVFHPEVKDVEMSEVFATTRKLLQATLIYCLSLIQ